ncbi:MAG: hypothetical protein KY468_15735 [Armatimonadetes bacterium]|nr:hypothetical protein [Armatimonadota bacterium]
MNPPSGATWKVTATADTIRIDGRLDASLQQPFAALRVEEYEPNESAAEGPGKHHTLSYPMKGRQIRLTLPRMDGSRDRIYSAFRLTGIASGEEARPLGAPRFVEEMTGVASRTFPFPVRKSKKGLQVQMVEDAIALGVKHAALNVDLAQLVDLESRTDQIPYRMDGRMYYFRADTVKRLDGQVKPLSDAGMVVSFILLAYADPSKPALNRLMLHPDYDPSAPNRLGAFNTVTDEGLRQFKAAIEFLADRYTRPDEQYGRAVNYIVGNEVNSHWWWANQGRKSMEAFTEDYLRTLRVCNTAVRKIYRNARTYVSLEHHWNIRFGDDPLKAFPARPFLDLLNQKAKAQGDFPWHVAFHPYPENLFEPATWNDKTATPGMETPRVTFKNLEVLVRYLNQKELRYEGRPRRIILSEQGFHTKDGPEGEALQAAAYLYAYYKVARMPRIDSFILHRHVDHKNEGGLKLGLWTWKEDSPIPSEPGRQKKLYAIFRDVDRQPWNLMADFALPIIGIERWEELSPPKE